MKRTDARIFPFTMMAIVCAMLFFAAGSADAKPGRSSKRQLTICHDTEFALCAASTCVATGGFVKNNQGKKYPAVTCECPILVGDNVADLNGGNMKGSCTSSNPDFVYSTFEFSDSFPQLICPLEKTSDSFVTQAGQGDSSACAELPVGGPLFFNPSSTHTDNGH